MWSGPSRLYYLNTKFNSNGNVMLYYPGFLKRKIDLLASDDAPVPTEQQDAQTFQALDP